MHFLCATQTNCLNPCDHSRTISSMIYYNDLKKKEVRKVEQMREKTNIIHILYLMS